MRLIHAMALVGLAVLVPVSNPGCSKYGEGAICDPLNNDPQTNISNDCDDGLVCTPGLCASTAICCPPPGHAVTSPACNNMLANCGTGGGNNTGGMNPGTSVGGFGTGGSGGGGAPPTCPHDQCEVGVQLLDGFETINHKSQPICSVCVNLICDGDGTAEHPGDMSCCTHAWDVQPCVNKVASICNLSCNLGTGGGSGGSTTTGGGGGAGGSSSSTGL